MGKYEMGRTLGEGHFGKVKLARHADTGRTFAIKILDRSKILSLRIDDQVPIYVLLCPFRISIQSAGRPSSSTDSFIRWLPGVGRLEGRSGRSSCSSTQMSSACTRCVACACACHTKPQPPLLLIVHSLPWFISCWSGCFSSFHFQLDYQFFVWTRRISDPVGCHDARNELTCSAP